MKWEFQKSSASFGWFHEVFDFEWKGLAVDCSKWGYIKAHKRLVSGTWTKHPPDVTVKASVFFSTSETSTGFL